MSEFLRATDVIDWHHPAVMARARVLRAGASDPATIARQCFEWVRDEIRHSTDFALTAVTCAGSEVLEQGSGYCYAKSHLLAALLRANGLPAGLCYQRLGVDDDGARFCLHGFTAVLLPDIGWYRVDPRGNRPGIHARFLPPRECLAFAATRAGELDVPGIWADPLPVVVHALRAYSDARVLAQHLPDLEPDAFPVPFDRRHREVTP